MARAWVHATNYTPKWPPGVHPVATPKHQKSTHTIPSYERPPSTYHCYKMQPHIAYIPRELVRLVFSLYWRVGLLFVLMRCAPSQHAFSARTPGRGAFLLADAIWSQANLDCDIYMINTFQHIYILTQPTGVVALSIICFYPWSGRLKRSGP